MTLIRIYKDAHRKRCFLENSLLKAQDVFVLVYEFFLRTRRLFDE